MRRTKSTRRTRLSSLRCRHGRRCRRKRTPSLRSTCRPWPHLNGTQLRSDPCPTHPPKHTLSPGIERRPPSLKRECKQRLMPPRNWRRRRARRPSDGLWRRRRRPSGVDWRSWRRSWDEEKRGWYEGLGLPPPITAKRCRQTRTSRLEPEVGFAMCATVFQAPAITPPPHTRPPHNPPPNPPHPTPPGPGRVEEGGGGWRGAENDKPEDRWGGAEGEREGPYYGPTRAGDGSRG